MLRYPIILALVLFLGSPLARSASADWGYEVGMINKTDEAVNGAAFRSENLSTGVGYLGSGHRATVGIYTVALPTEGDVEWTSADGKKHSVHVMIPAKPQPFDGVLWLKIMPDGTAVAVPLTGAEYYD